MSRDPRPGSWMELFYLDDEGILFCAPTQSLYALNATGTLIWSLLEEGHDEASASATLAQISGMDATSSSEFVATAIAQWRANHFLEGSRPAFVEREVAAATATATPGIAWQPFAPAATHDYALLESRFRIAYATAEQQRWVHPVLAHLEVDAAPGATSIDVVPDGPQFHVFSNRALHQTCAAHDELAPIVKSLVWSIAVNNHQYFLDIHAGVIGDGSRCVLFPAPPGSGKSTLTAALMAAGFEFFSDEVALLNETLEVEALPLALGIKRAGIDALAKAFPELRELPLHHRSDGKRIAYLPPRQVLRRDPQPVAALVFPLYQEGAPTKLRAEPRAGALQKLFDECLVIPAPLDLSQVTSLIRWVAQLRCYTLQYGSTDAAVQAVELVFADCATWRP